MKGQGMGELSGGAWRTVNGARVYIKGGKVVAGPDALVGTGVGGSVTCATPRAEIEAKAREVGGIDTADLAAPWGESVSDNELAKASAYATGSDYRPTDRDLEVLEAEVSEDMAVLATRARNFAREQYADLDEDADLVRGVVLPGELIDQVIEKGEMALTGVSAFGTSHELTEMVVENWPSHIKDPVTVQIDLARDEHAAAKVAMWGSQRSHNGADFSDIPEDYPYEVVFGGNFAEFTRVEQRVSGFDYKVTIRLRDTPTDGRRRVEPPRAVAPRGGEVVWADPGKRFSWER